MPILEYSNISIWTDRVSAGWFARQPFVTQTKVTILLGDLHGVVSQTDGPAVLEGPDSERAPALSGSSERSITVVLLSPVDTAHMEPSEASGAGKELSLVRSMMPSCDMFSVEPTGRAEL